MSASSVNYSVEYNGGRCRVMCIKCGQGGTQNIKVNFITTCHKCNDGSGMLPASNNKVECSWEEAQQFYKEVYGE